MYMNIHIRILLWPRTIRLDRTVLYCTVYPLCIVAKNRIHLNLVCYLDIRVYFEVTPVSYSVSVVWYLLPALLF